MKYKIFLGLAIILAIFLFYKMTAKAEVQKTVTISYGGYEWQTTTDAEDVASLLVETWGSYDTLRSLPSPETPLEDGDHVEIEDTQAVAINEQVAKNIESFKAAQAAPPPTPEPEKPQPKAIPTPEQPKPDVHSGLATWYSHGTGLTAASRQFPKGTKLKVVAVNSGKSVEVVINDYGPQAHTGIDLDLNKEAFATIAPLGAGKVAIKYYKI